MSECPHDGVMPAAKGDGGAGATVRRMHSVQRGGGHSLCCLVTRVLSRLRLHLTIVAVVTIVTIAAAPIRAQHFVQLSIVSANDKLSLGAETMRGMVEARVVGCLVQSAQRRRLIEKRTNMQCAQKPMQGNSNRQILIRG
eukprot:COSAG05_NODE_1755_length_4142_cov_3.966114_2_plen_140_part_00